MYRIYPSSKPFLAHSPQCISGEWAFCLHFGHGPAEEPKLSSLSLSLGPPPNTNRQQHSTPFPTVPTFDGAPGGALRSEDDRLVTSWYFSIRRAPYVQPSMPLRLPTPFLCHRQSSPPSPRRLSHTAGFWSASNEAAKPCRWSLVLTTER